MEFTLPENIGQGLTRQYWYFAWEGRGWNYTK